MVRTPGKGGRSLRRGAFALAAAAAGLSAPPGSAAPAPGDGVVAAPDAPLRYDRDVRPLLSDRCFRCHGPDEKKRRAKLRLDDPASAFEDRDGAVAITPGNPDESELIRRIASADPKERMPPPSSNKQPFTAAEQALLRAWIEQGARYEEHWSFVPPQRLVPPSAPSAFPPALEPWCRSPVDRFILADLQSDGIAPGPEADPETLLRRLHLDLTGLPPTPEEIDAFLSDARPDAWERTIDRLFHEEPWRSRHAERMAVPWLDAARYADTCGIHTDAGRQIWPWRDWALRAFRENMPFDRFVVEQLAGDLLPGATESQKVASGFLRNHVTTDEGGAIPEEYLVEYAVDRTATTGSVFLALTLGCARCHEHKYDPISHEDFYRFYAYFNSNEEPGLYSQLPDPNRAFEPAMKVPAPVQQAEFDALAAELAQARAELELPTPEEAELEQAFLAGLPAQTGLSWKASELVSATAPGSPDGGSGATLAPQPDGSVLASGPNPARDDHDFVLRTEAARLRLLALEALPDPSLPEGRIGRAPNGNAVLTGVELEAVSVADPTLREPVRFAWAFADHEQDNWDHRVVNVLDTRDELGWAVDGHGRPGGRVALLLAEKPFGFEGGTELRVRLQYRSIYPQHTLGRVRLSVGDLDERALERLPAAASGWYVAGPFPSGQRDEVFDQPFGPESDVALDRARTFGAGNESWRYDPNLHDGRTHALASGVGASYVARRLFAPTPRRLEVSLGSDDGFRLFLDGREVASNRVDRGVAPDQDRAALDLAAGTNVVVMKIVNTGGVAGFYWSAKTRPDELAGDLAIALLPEGARTAGLTARLHEAWKTAFSPGWRQRRERIAALEKQVADFDARLPRTMVMQELAAPRATYVLERGEYDKPDPARPVERGIPAALGQLPEGAPANRLGLAQWLVSPDNPLVARVAVNRWWEMLFDAGIVRTTEDFGLQGEWPSHPELLDWLAVELRESGWNVQHLLRILVTSSTYRQSSRARPEVREIDPENRRLSWFPRRRLGAEQLRDQALFVAGLLVERLGGPSVKPYQPDGLWSEVAMPASNTRTFTLGAGDELWRRSLYTYWKRACPPPSLQMFDAPTREFCTIRRTATNTPLQALVLWNDEQFVEAARVLAQRTLTEAGDDEGRLARMHRRCTGRPPAPRELDLLAGLLAGFRRRYEAAPADAGRLLGVGSAPRSPGLPAPELAAWTLLASALLNLDATVCRS